MKGQGTRIAGYAATFALGVGVTLFAVWLAMPNGAGQPTVPAAAPAFEGPAASMVSPATAPEPLPDVDTMIEGLAARLQASPNDPDGWKMLGWSYFNTGDFAKAADAYRKAAALIPPDAELLSLIGEATAKADRGRIGPETLKTFEESLALDPANMRSMFYKGVALAQGGQPQAAIDLWLRLLRAAPADAPWRPDLLQSIADTAQANGIAVPPLY